MAVKSIKILELLNIFEALGAYTNFNCVRLVWALREGVDKEMIFTPPPPFVEDLKKSILTFKGRISLPLMTLKCTLKWAIYPLSVPTTNSICCYYNPKKNFKIKIFFISAEEKVGIIFLRGVYFFKNIMYISFLPSFEYIYKTMAQLNIVLVN